MVIERRRYSRLKTSYMGRYRSNELGDPTYREVTLRDISAGGAKFTTGEDLDVGTNIDVELELPRVGKVPLPAVVVRAERVKGVQRYNIAVEFKEKDRRKFPRVKVNYLARYKLEDSQEQDFRVVSLKNIGAGGVLFITDEELKVNSGIYIELTLPGIGRTPLLGVIVRVKELSRIAVKLYNVAVKFTSQKIYKNSLNYIENLVEKELIPT